MTASAVLYRVRAASACDIPRLGGQRLWEQSPLSALPMYRQAVRQMPEAVAVCALGLWGASVRGLDGGRVSLSLGSRYGMRCVGQLMSLILRTGGRAELDPLLFAYFSPQVVTAVVSQRLSLDGETCTLVGEAADLHALQAGTRLLFLNRSDLAIVGAWDFPDLIRADSGGYEAGPGVPMPDPGAAHIFLVDRFPASRAGALRDTKDDVIGYTSKPRWIAHRDMTAEAVESLVSGEWGIPMKTISAIYVQRSAAAEDSPVIRACESLNGAVVRVSSSPGLSSLQVMKDKIETASGSRWLIIGEQEGGGCIIAFNAGREALNA